MNLNEIIKSLNDEPDRWQFYEDKEIKWRAITDKKSPQFISLMALEHASISWESLRLRYAVWKWKKHEKRFHFVKK